MAARARQHSGARACHPGPEGWRKPFGETAPSRKVHARAKGVELQARRGLARSCWARLQLEELHLLVLKPGLEFLKLDSAVPSANAVILVDFDLQQDLLHPVFQLFVAEGRVARLELGVQISSKKHQLVKAKNTITVLIIVLENPLLSLPPTRAESQLLLRADVPSVRLVAYKFDRKGPKHLLYPLQPPRSRRFTPAFLGSVCRLRGTLGCVVRSSLHNALDQLFHVARCVCEHHERRKANFLGDDSYP